jgi:protein-L-isoaspartate(D-aspartate) O-methyltransferase
MHRCRVYLARPLVAVLRYQSYFVFFVSEKVLGATRGISVRIIACKAIVGMVYCLGAFACDRGQIDTEPGRDPWRKEREHMVEMQLVKRGITDVGVLNVMRRLPRHRFVPESVREYAYGDHPLPIGAEQTISQPYIVAYMTQALALSPEDRVLEIGTGSGYQTALLAELVASVYTIEIVEMLADKSAKTLREMGYKNIHARTGDGWNGWPEAAPFDAIIVTAAPGQVPELLVEQLKEGGRLVLPVGDRQQELLHVRKSDGQVQADTLLPVRFVPMTGRALEQ